MKMSSNLPRWLWKLRPDTRSFNIYSPLQREWQAPSIQITGSCHLWNLRIQAQLPSNDQICPGYLNNLNFDSECSNISNQKWDTLEFLRYLEMFKIFKDQTKSYKIQLLPSKRWNLGFPSAEVHTLDFLIPEPSRRNLKPWLLTLGHSCVVKIQH